MNERIDTQVTMAVPAALVGQLAEVVDSYSKLHREDVEACRRGVEIAALQRGLSAVRAEISENAALGRRMGWKEESGS